TTLNPGTYYVVMESNGTFVGDYVFESTFNSSGELAMPDGFDGRDNYNAEYVIYGDRYIYVIEPDNHVAVYNHLLQAVAREMSADGSVDYSNNCGKPFYYDTKLYINKTYIENGTATCKEYASISVENTDSHFEYESMGYSEIYYDNINSVSITDRSIINIDNDYVYEFSKSEGSIFKTLYSEIDKRDEYSQYVYKRAYGHITGMTNLNDIKALKNDENIDIVAVNSNISIYKTNPDSPVSHTYQVYDEYGYPVYDELNNPVYDTYIDYEPILIGTKTFPVSGNVIDMHIDRESDVVYVLNENSTNITLINYDINDVTLSASTSVDIGVQASGMFIKENKIYFTIEDSSFHGMKVYDYPLTISATAVKEAENIGANLSAPYTWDGTTFNYLSNLSPKVFYLEQSFVDGQTIGTYSVAEEDNIKEGEEELFEGCFIATAAYGSYFESHVKVLRDFRDNILLTNSFGKKIVDFYYRNSPYIASKIAMHSGAKNIIRQMLTPIVYFVKYPVVFIGIFTLFILGFLIRGYITRRKVVLL
ncbi:MAG: hypothetical protein OQK11_04720, partial [Thiovulaceae bacterium]|nr:hypothetical protein [Sulfurimonadaceae bacterium]